MGTPCPSCGGVPTGDRASCRDALDELLAFEFVNPAAFGPVHHLTVACFYLQHPEGHVPGALAMWRELISAPEAGRAFAEAALARARRTFDGATPVRDASAPAPEWWPRSWETTVWDTLPAAGPLEAEGHASRVRAWARSVAASLDAADRR